MSGAPTPDHWHNRRIALHFRRRRDPERGSHPYANKPNAEFRIGRKECAIGHREGVAVFDFAAEQAFLEPALPLLGGAVGEGVRHDAALLFLLNGIVADGVGGAHGFLDIAAIELQGLLRVIRPDAGEEVGLEFEANRVFVVIRPITHRRHLGREAEQVLHVMTHLVGDHIGLGEVAG